MIYAILKTLHVLSIIVWIGGMVFTHFFLRPAVAQLEPAVRLPLMHAVLGRSVLYKRLGRAVAASEWVVGGTALAQISNWVSINLGLGVLVLLVTLLR
ncbi:MAG: hypothetical protein ACKVQR_20985 [Aquabacterium sp.]